MSHEIELLVVTEHPGSVATLLDRDRFTARTSEPAEAMAAFTQRRPDCLVISTESIPSTLAARASQEGCPVVEFDADAGEPADTDDLAARISAAVDDPTDHQSADGGAASDDRPTREGDDSTVERDRITRLHAGSAELVGIDDRQQLYDRTVEIASEILDFDIAVVFLRDPDQFRRVATTDSSVAETRDHDHGIIAEVFDTGEPRLVDDIQNHEVAHTHSPEYRSGIAVPFGDVGVLVGLSAAYGAFDDADLELAELLASHAAQVDARLRAEESLRERQAIITQLHRAAPALIDAESEQELYERTVEIAENVLEFDRSVLFAVDGDAFTVVAGRGEDRSKVPPEGSVLYRTHDSGESILVTDVEEVPEAAPTYETTRSGLSVPVGDSAVFQALSTQPNAFDESDLEHAELLTAYAGATLSRIRSEEALRESRELIEQLHATATDIAAAETEEQVLERAIATAEEVLSFHKCVISLREDDMLVPAVESERSPEDAARPMELSQGLMGRTYSTGESYRVDDVSSDDDTDPARSDYRSGISIPVGDLGVFQAIATGPNAFDDDDVHLAELLMAHVAVSLERVHAEADLRAQRDRLEALFENVPGAAISYEMVDGEPIIRRINSGFEETFGYDESTVIDKPLDEFVVPGTPEAEAEAEQYNERLERGERIQVEVERQTVDGRRYFLLQVIPLEIGEENSRGYAIYTDVTEQREREAALRRQNERLDQFASVVSHDLRNPLNVASGYLELARESGSEEQFDRVERALRRMDALVADLLTLAREGRDVGDTEPVELDVVAAEAWSHVTTDGVSLDIKTDHTIEADRDRLVELLENLYRNSVEHGSGDGSAEPTGGDGLTVTVADLFEDGEWRGYVVADDGVGLDDDIDPFETGTTTSENGTGFGLAIVKSIADAHGWSVTATDSEAGGARFEFRVG